MNRKGLRTLLWLCLFYRMYCTATDRWKKLLFQSDAEYCSNTFYWRIEFRSSHTAENTEPAFSNLFGAQETIPQNRFHQPMKPGGPIRQTYSYLVPIPHTMFKNSSTVVTYCWRIQLLNNDRAVAVRWRIQLWQTAGENSSNIPLESIAVTVRWGNSFSSLSNIPVAVGCKILSHLEKNYIASSLNLSGFLKLSILAPPYNLDS